MNKKLKNFLILSLALIMVITCYSVGSSKGLLVLLIAGFCFEVFFWRRLFTKKKI